MRFSFSGRASALAIVGAIAAAAGCSSSPPAQQAYVFVTLSPSAGGMCFGVAGNTPIIAIGSMGAPGANNPGRVPDGGSVHVSCSVSGSSPNFTISLSAKSDSTVTGGSFAITGSNISTSGGGSMVSGSFVGVVNGEYTASDCVLTYSFNGTPGVGGIAPGRVWGNVTCAGATNGAVRVDPAGDPSTCNVSADFVFENCSS